MQVAVGCRAEDFARSIFRVEPGALHDPVRGGALFRFSGGRFEKWLEGPEVERPNGV